MLAIVPDPCSRVTFDSAETRVTSSRSPSRVPSASVTHFCSPAISVKRRIAMTRIDATVSADSGAAVTAAGVAGNRSNGSGSRSSPSSRITSASWTVRDSSARSPVTIRMRPSVMAAGAPTVTS